jgi:hypothetical protein
VPGALKSYQYCPLLEYICIRRHERFDAEVRGDLYSSLLAIAEEFLLFLDSYLLLNNSVLSLEI